MSTVLPCSPSLALLGLFHCRASPELHAEVVEKVVEGHEDLLVPSATGLLESGAYGGHTDAVVSAMRCVAPEGEAGN